MHQNLLQWKQNEFRVRFPCLHILFILLLLFPALLLPSFSYFSPTFSFLSYLFTLHLFSEFCFLSSFLYDADTYNNIEPNFRLESEFLRTGDMPSWGERGLGKGIWNHFQVWNRKEVCFLYRTAGSPLRKFHKDMVLVTYTTRA